MNFKYYKFLEKKNAKARENEVAEKEEASVKKVKHNLNQFSNNYDGVKEFKTKHNKTDDTSFKKLIQKPSVWLYLIVCVLGFCIFGFLVFSCVKFFLK